MWPRSKIQKAQFRPRTHTTEESSADVHLVCDSHEKSFLFAFASKPPPNSIRSLPVCHPKPKN